MGLFLSARGRPSAANLPTWVQYLPWHHWDINTEDSENCVASTVSSPQLHVIDKDEIPGTLEVGPWEAFGPTLGRGRRCFWTVRRRNTAYEQAPSCGWEQLLVSGGAYERRYYEGEARAAGVAKRLNNAVAAAALADHSSRTAAALKVCLDALLRMLPDYCKEFSVEQCDDTEMDAAICRAAEAVYGMDRGAWPVGVRKAAEGLYN